MIYHFFDNLVPLLLLQRDCQSAFFRRMVFFILNNLLYDNLFRFLFNVLYEKLDKLVRQC